MGNDADSVTVSNNGGNWSAVGGLVGDVWYKPTVDATNITIKGTSI